MCIDKGDEGECLNNGLKMSLYPLRLIKVN